MADGKLEPVKTFGDFAEESEIHGIKQITRSNNGLIRRVIWTLLCLAAVTMLVNSTVRQIIRFLEYEHQTTYDIKFYNELGIEFPSITVCNMNKYRRSALSKADIAVMGPHIGLTDQDINLYHPEQYPQDWYNDTFPGTDWDAVKAENPVADFNMTDFVLRTGHEFTSMVQLCLWRGSPCKENLWRPVLTHMGKCYQFNHEGTLVLQQAGAGNGLVLVLYDEEIEYTNSEDLGFKFFPHQTIEPPFLKELGYGLGPGYHHLVSMKQQELIALPDPYGKCEEDHVTTYYQNYSVPGCRIECETELIYEKCGCRLVESPGDHPVCTVEQFDCAEETLNKIEHSDACLCHNPCHAREYQVQQSSLRLRTQTVDMLKKEHAIPPHLTEKQLVVLNIYFGQLAKEVIAQKPAYPLLTIFSDFGGSMGFWMGGSILSLCQLFDYLMISFAARNNRNTAKISIEHQEKSEPKLEA